jgi:hypothetical protein
MVNMTNKQIALKYRKQMFKLEQQRDKIYASALKELGIEDSDWAWDYLINHPPSEKDSQYDKMCWESMFGEPANAPLRP